MDSVQGIIIILLLIWLVTAVIRHAFKAVAWCFFLIVLIQIGYILGTTNLNDVIPFSEIFKYDVISAVANLFPDTFVHTALLKVSAFLRQIFTDFAATVQVLWGKLHLEHIWNSLKEGFDAVYGDL